MMRAIKESITKRVPKVTKHIAIGALISSIIAFALRIVLLGMIYTILKNFSCLGVRVFDEALLAMTLIMIGGTYIPGGFLGGLYVGYKVKKKLRTVLVFSALVGCIILLALLYFSLGYRITYNIEVEHETRVPILVPLLGVIIGTYLGGYTIDWGKPREEISEGELVEALEEVPRSPILTDIKGIGPRRAERLIAAGIKTVEDLIKASPEAISAKTGIPEKTVQKLIEYAKRRAEEIS